MGLSEDLRNLRSLRRQVERQLDAPQTFGQTLRQLRLERRMTLDDLARASGISKPYLSQVENGHVDPPRDEKVRRLEEVFGRRPRSLIELAHLARAPEDVRRRLAQLRGAFARAEETVETLLKHLPQAPSAATPGPPQTAAAPPRPDADASDPQAVTRAVPIINRVAAGYPAEFTDLDYPAGVADAYIGAPPGLDDPNVFAVRVVGDSMEPRYHEGDIVLFSPRAAVRSGDDCYVRFSPDSPNGHGAVFKRLYFDTESTVRLQPLNDRYPPTVVPLVDVAGIYRAAYRYESL